MEKGRKALRRAGGIEKDGGGIEKGRRALRKTGGHGEGQVGMGKGTGIWEGWGGRARVVQKEHLITSLTPWKVFRSN